MPETHPNIALFSRFDPTNISDSLCLFSDDVVWHYYNTHLPDLHGDYVGHSGVKDFFRRIGERMRGSFSVHPITATPVGDQLVVMQNRNSMQLDGAQIEVDVVVVWRIVDGLITEVWDIPAN